MKVLAQALLSLLCVFFVDFLRAQDPAPSPDARPSQATVAGTPAQAPAPASFEITGIVRAGKTPLPGVTVTASNTLTGKKFSVATAANGTYTFAGGQEMGEVAKAPVLPPPPGPADPERMWSVASKYGVEILGPPPGR